MRVAEVLLIAVLATGIGAVSVAATVNLSDGSGLFSLAKARDNEIRRFLIDVPDCPPKKIIVTVLASFRSLGGLLCRSYRGKRSTSSSRQYRATLLYECQRHLREYR